MVDRQKCMLLFAALLLLGAAMLPGVHRLQHSAPAILSKCAEHGPSGAIEPADGDEDDCSLCTLLLAQRHWHGGGGAVVVAAPVEPPAFLRIDCVRCAHAEAPTPSLARAPPHLLG